MFGPLSTLSAAYEAPSVGRDGARDDTLPVAVVSWPAVPLEIVRAAGMRPVVVRGDTAPTPKADVRLEPGAFPNRLRQLFERVLEGRLRHAGCIILPRTSDPDYKAFLYLRELIRQDVTKNMPPVLLFDLLQSNGPDVPSYNAARARDLFETLAVLAGGRASHDDVRDAIAQTNLARRALRRLVALRVGEPRVGGAEALPLLGAFWQLAPGEYAALANEAADVVSRRATLRAPRVLLLGAPVDGSVLHAGIEALGAVVVAEIGPWGSEMALEDVSQDGDPFFAIAEWYRRNALGARAPIHGLRSRLERMASGVDAVVVLQPPDDAVFGWDYPALRDWLQARQLPHVRLGGDPCLPLDTSDRERLAHLLAVATSRVGASHG